MRLKDEDVFALVDKLGVHFRANISNHFTERMLASIPLDAETRNLIVEITERGESYQGPGYHLDDLYRQIVALARYVYQIRQDILPHIRTLSPTRAACIDQADRIRRDMAISNFGPNLKILSDTLSELYVKVVALDKEASGERSPAYSKQPELREIGRYLVG